MKNYEKIIVTKLLDSYENRTENLKTGSGRKQRIYFRFTPKNIPEYFDTRLTTYDDIHKIADDLEHRGIIKCHWKNNQKDYILEKVELHMGDGMDPRDDEVLQTAYSLAGRIPAKSKEASYFEYMENCPHRNQTIDALHHWICQRLATGQSVKRYLDLDDLAEFKQILKGVATIMSNEKECFVREMSMLLYGDSKRLEELQGKMESVIREFSHKDNGEDIFEEYNVFKNPSIVLLKGCGQIQIGEGTVDLTQFKQGLGLCSEDLQNVKFGEAATVEKLITVENLTAFYRFHEEKSLIIYLGGFHNKARRELIQRAVKTHKRAQLFHWGDIDVGGFRIYFDLCQKTTLPFKPLYMDGEILMKYANYARPFTKNDEKAVESLRDFVKASLCNASDLNISQSDLTQILDTLNLMRENKIKLEQEIVAYLRM